MIQFLLYTNSRKRIVHHHLLTPHPELSQDSTNELQFLKAATPAQVQFVLWRGR
jgi:hypothetical protein